MTDWLLGPKPARLVALHGFTQRGTMFSELADLLDGGIWAPDLPGHGSEPAAESWDDAIARVARAITPVAPLPVLGYSQGGRLALGLVFARPDLVSSLILLSASPGIADEDERRQRQHADEALATQIEEVGTERFLVEWLDRPMFSGMAAIDDEWRRADMASRGTNSPAGLASALRAYGAGVMPFLGDKLAGLSLPTTIVVGGEDESYRQRGFDMARRSGASLHVIGGAGHAVVAEAPYEVANIVRDLL